MYLYSLFLSIILLRLGIHGSLPSFPLCLYVVYCLVNKSYLGWTFFFDLCSSSRSIKRRRFDDELVESSLGTSGNLASKMARTRTQSTSSPGLSQYSTTYNSRIPSTPNSSCASGQYVMKSLLCVTLHQLLTKEFYCVRRHIICCG